MLTKEQKERVALSVELEEYRAALKKKKSSGVSLWSFANSAFGLWFLSVIIVTWLTAGVTKYLEFRDDQVAKHECLLDLQGEILERFDQLYTLVGREMNLDFFEAAMSGGKRQKYLIIATGPRIAPSQFNQQPFASLSATQLFRIVESSVDERVRGDVKILKEDALLLDLELSSSLGDDGLAAQILKRYWQEYSEFVQDQLGSIDPEKLSKSCRPMSYVVTKTRI